MTRRGRCQCGHMLHFELGPDGYKVRCPDCGSVVRLRADGRHKHAPALLAPPLPDSTEETPPSSVAPETLPALPPAATEPEPALVLQSLPRTPTVPPSSWTEQPLFIVLGVGVAVLVGALLCGLAWLVMGAS
jgi:hypothetical protein